MFSDKSHFTVISESGYQLLWSERRTHYAEECVCELDLYDSGVLVWASIMHNAKHCFTCLSEVMYHWSSTAKGLFWIMIIF